MKKLFLIATILSVFGLSANAQTVYNFNDGSWGDCVDTRLESGAFPTNTINEVKFNKAVMFQKDGKGIKRVLVDKASKKGYLEFNVPAGTKEVIVEASVGTEGNTFILQENVNGKWRAVGEPVVLSKKAESYTVKISEEATQIRVMNGTSSGMYIYKVTLQ